MSSKSKKIFFYSKISIIFLLLSAASFLSGFVIFLVPVYVSGVIFFLIFIIMTLVFWRCPRCKKVLPIHIIKRVNTVHCPNCLKNLINDDYDGASCEQEVLQQEYIIQSYSKKKKN